MWSPATPAQTDRIVVPDIRSASATACWMERTVRSRFTTTPRRSPSEGEVPMPRMRIPSPRSSRPATTAVILVVPMSSPA
jgi:hypothetical protein